jgi:hypothetical protein
MKYCIFYSSSSHSYSASAYCGLILPTDMNMCQTLFPCLNLTVVSTKRIYKRKRSLDQTYSQPSKECKPRNLTSFNPFPKPCPPPPKTHPAPHTPAHSPCASPSAQESSSSPNSCSQSCYRVSVSPSHTTLSPVPLFSPSYLSCRRRHSSTCA